MKLTADIYITSEKVPALKRCFDAEIPAMQTQRSTVTLHCAKETMHFAITATDATALRATCVGITKLITVFEKGAEDHDE